MQASAVPHREGSGSTQQDCRVTGHSSRDLGLRGWAECRKPARVAQRPTLILRAACPWAADLRKGLIISGDTGSPVGIASKLRLPRAWLGDFSAKLHRSI